MLIRCNTSLWANWEELAFKKKKVPDDKRYFNTEMLKHRLDIRIVEICIEPWFATSLSFKVLWLTISPKMTISSVLCQVRYI